MSYAYPHSHGASSGSYRPVSREPDMEPATFSQQMRDYLPSWTQQWAMELTNGIQSWDGMLSLLRRTFRWIFTITNALVVLWACTLWWGERTIFQDSVKACAWGNWEKWVCDIVALRSFADCLYLWIHLTVVLCSLKTPCRTMSRSSPIPN